MNTTFSSHLGNDVGFQITVTSMTREHHVVKVWFDSACPLCSREIRIMRKLDWFNKVDFVDVLSHSRLPNAARTFIGEVSCPTSWRAVVEWGCRFRSFMEIITTSSSSWRNSEDPIRSSDPRDSLS